MKKSILISTILTLFIALVASGVGIYNALVSSDMNFMEGIKGLLTIFTRVIILESGKIAFLIPVIFAGVIVVLNTLSIILLPIKKNGCLVYAPISNIVLTAIVLFFGIAIIPTIAIFSFDSFKLMTWIEFIAVACALILLLINSFIPLFVKKEEKLEDNILVSETNEEANEETKKEEPVSKTEIVKEEIEIEEIKVVAEEPKTKTKEEPQIKEEEKKVASKPSTKRKSTVKKSDLVKEVSDKEKEEKEEKKESSKAKPKKATKKETKKPEAVVEEKEIQTSSSTEPMKVYHVAKRKADGKWTIKFATGKKVIKLFDTKAEAIEYVTELCKNQGGTYVTHASKGKYKGKIQGK